MSDFNLILKNNATTKVVMRTGFFGTAVPVLKFHGTAVPVPVPVPEM